MVVGHSDVIRAPIHWQFREPQKYHSEDQRHARLAFRDCALGEVCAKSIKTLVVVHRLDLLFRSAPLFQTANSLIRCPRRLAGFFPPE
jgi:hypothetical protein